MRAFAAALAAAATAALVLAGCATFDTPALDEARGLMGRGQFEEAVEVLRKAMEEHPGEPRYRSDYVRQRELAVNQLLTQADNERIAGNAAAATLLLRRVMGIDRGNARAAAGLEQLTRESRYVDIIAAAEKALAADDLAGADARLQPLLLEDPNHRAARALERRIAEKRTKDGLRAPALSDKLAKNRLSLELRDVALRAAFEALTRSAGINFVLDRDVRPDLRTTIFVRDQTASEIIDMLLVSNQLEKKVVNETTLLVYPNTPQKQKDYRELVVKSFYLANADAKQTLNLIRTIVKTRDVFVDDKLNLIVMRDTPDAIRLAERLIAAQDLADSEVVLAVEVLEVAHSKIMELGARWPDQVAYSLVGGAAAGGTAGTAGQLTLAEWLGRNSGLVRMAVTNPFFTVNLRQQDGQTNLLANPRIRVKNREKARVHIGDRVPVITSTATTGGFVSQSVNYLDVGLKLDVEPTISIDDAVGIKVTLEVSNIVREVTTTSTAGNTLTYQIGTRSANTVLRLQDGETQILAGLITDEDRRTANRVPGVGDLPVFGRLFTSQSSNVTKTEIVLLITPRIVRTVARPEARIIEFASGTESAIGGGASGGASPVPQPATAPAPAQPAPGGGLPRQPSPLLQGGPATSAPRPAN